MSRKSLCNKDLYKAYLVASSMRYSGLALSEVSPEKISHDSVSRWLSTREYRPSMVWEESKDLIDKSQKCLLIADDTVLDKSRSEKIELVKWQYSGNAHKIIGGIGMVNMVWHGIESDMSIPLDYRIYDKDADGKTKNTHFRDMLSLAKVRGITPEFVVVDTWYSSLDNLKCIRSLGWNFVAGIRKNRKVNRNENIENLDIPDEGLRCHLRGYGWVKVFRFVRNERRTDYIVTNVENLTNDQIKNIMKMRWDIEVYHRELKQTCGIECCMSRTGRAQRNHICIAVLAWLYRFKKRLVDSCSFYHQQWSDIKNSITANIKLILS